MKRIGLTVLMVIAVISLLVPVVAVLADDSSEESWHPSIADKKLHPDYLKPFESSTPVPESEIAHITIPKDWLLNNDMEPNPSTVTITFPERWVRDAPKCAPLEDTVELCVPKRMLADANRSKNPSEFSVTFPNRYFKGLEVPENTPKYAIDPPEAKAGSVGVDHMERRWYEHSSGYDDIVGARGTVTPYSYMNPDDEDFVSYHEIEFGGSNASKDWIEIICEMRDMEDDAKIWFAIYPNGSESFYEWIKVETMVEIGDECYWEFYTKDYGEGPGDEYHMFWLNYDDEWYFDSLDDTSPPDHYDHFVGSAELDHLYNESEDDYLVTTFDLFIDNFLVEVESEEYEWQPSDYIQDALTYDKSETDTNVEVSRSLEESGLYFGYLSYD